MACSTTCSEILRQRLLLHVMPVETQRAHGMFGQSINLTTSSSVTFRSPRRAWARASSAKRLQLCGSLDSRQQQRIRLGGKTKTRAESERQLLDLPAKSETLVDQNSGSASGLESREIPFPVRRAAPTSSLACDMDSAGLGFCSRPCRAPRRVWEFARCQTSCGIVFAMVAIPFIAGMGDFSGSPDAGFVTLRLTTRAAGKSPAKLDREFHAR